MIIIIVIVIVDVIIIISIIIIIMKDMTGKSIRTKPQPNTTNHQLWA